MKMLNIVIRGYLFKEISNEKLKSHEKRGKLIYRKFNCSGHLCQRIQLIEKKGKENYYCIKQAYIFLRMVEYHCKIIINLLFINLISLKYYCLISKMIDTIRKRRNQIWFFVLNHLCSKIKVKKKRERKV